MPNIVFTTRLTEADWDDTLRGWRCPPLAVPGAVVEALYVEGNRVDSAKFEVLKEHAVIRWTPADQPQRVAASVSLTEDLTLGTETDRWKKLAIVLPVVATIASATIGALATYFSKIGDQAPITQAGHPPPPISASVSPPSNNTSPGKALDVALGQPVRGSTDEVRWFKFSAPDAGPTQTPIAFRNLYNSGSMNTIIWNSIRTKVTSALINSGGGKIGFTSPAPDTYYLSVEPFLGTTVSYEIIVTIQ